MMNWRQIDRLRVSHIRKAQRLAMMTFAGIRNQLKAEMQNVNNVDTLKDIAGNFIFDEQKAWNLWYQIYQDTGIDFAERNYRHLKGRQKHYRKKDINDAIRRSVWATKLLEYVDTECGEMITATIRSTYTGIQNNTIKAVRLAAENGWGAERTTNEILKLQGQMDRYKAQRIARTEVMRASNEGAFEGVADIGIALNKVWIATTDGRERETHAAVDGQVVDYNDKFDVDGEKLDYPGDPAGSEENTINCRCAVAFEPKESLL